MTFKIDDTWYIRPGRMPEHDCAGGVVVRFSLDEIYLATTGEIDTGILNLPKGHVEDGEELVMAARREIEEETGINKLTLIKYLGVKERLDFEKTS